jgi:nickel-dependent lactate racemase
MTENNKQLEVYEQLNESLFTKELKNIVEDRKNRAVVHTDIKLNLQVKTQPDISVVRYPDHVRIGINYNDDEQIRKQLDKQISSEVLKMLVFNKHITQEEADSIAKQPVGSWLTIGFVDSLSNYKI